MMRFGLIEEFHGLRFETAVATDASIVAVIGRNGAGKTRLLRAIAEGKIKVADDHGEIPQGRIRLLTLAELQPAISLGFDPLQHREQLKQAVATYEQWKGQFSLDAHETLGRLGPQAGRMQRISPMHVAFAVSRAARILRKDPNALTGNEVTDFFRPDEITALGTLNILSTVRSYWDRLDQNDYAEFRNARHGESNPHYLPEELVQRFGPAPWVVLNEILANVLDGKYRIDVPSQQNINTYDANLRRSTDGKVLDQSLLSSGERVLLWLGLSMYASQAGQVGLLPKVLLLDEPDGVLHPQMVQKLHAVLAALSTRFDLKIIFSTHSPTTIALFNSGPIWRVEETSLVEVAKEEAISELLVGLDEVYVHYAKARHVYVESHKDAELYTELFTQVRRWSSDLKAARSLVFVASGPKLPPENLRQLLKAHLEIGDDPRLPAFLAAVNGLGGCEQVRAAVESLNAEGGVPVHGVIDWDTRNRAEGQIHILGFGIFYSIENAMLNPLTLGLYLLHNFNCEVKPETLGLAGDIDRVHLYDDAELWQKIADAVTMRVLSVETVVHDVECAFMSGAKVKMDARYVHMNGHDLHTLLLMQVFPFLNRRRTNLLMDVARQGMGACSARSMPSVFSELFRAIQG
jgi:ABC-type cobalamin/Fe3+-siderophores transport system ATPase subunit